MAETQARHRSTEEYRRDLVREVTQLADTKEDLLKQIHRAEIKLKGLSTMVDNLQSRREEIQQEVDEIARQFGQEGVDTAELAFQMGKLRKELEQVDEKLALRKQQIENANNTLEAAREKLAEMQEHHADLQNIISKEEDVKTAIQQRDLLATMNGMVDKAIEPLLPTLTDRQKMILEESGYNALTEQSLHVFTTALMLLNGFVSAATNYAESHGGCGSPGTGWGRDKDDDDERWWRRCIATAASMMRPSGRKIGRKR